MNRVLLIMLSTALCACVQPTHLQYDFGRAYTETFRAQADLTRPSAANQSYSLYGPEAAAIRINVQAAATEEKTTESTVTR